LVLVLVCQKIRVPAVTATMQPANPATRGSAAAIDMREHPDSHRPDRGEADEVAGVPVGSNSVTTVSFAAADVCTAGGQMV
jgi:hypothetical protein